MTGRTTVPRHEQQSLSGSTSKATDKDKDEAVAESGDVATAHGDVPESGGKTRHPAKGFRSRSEWLIQPMPRLLDKSPDLCEGAEQHGGDTTLDELLKQPSTAFLDIPGEEEDCATSAMSAESPPPSPLSAPAADEDLPPETAQGHVDDAAHGHGAVDDEEEKFEEYERLCLTYPRPVVVDLDVSP